MKILHIINPYATDNFEEQEISLQSLITARDFSNEKVNVNFLAVSHIQEDIILPDEFVNRSSIDRYVTKIGSFKYSRPLPLLKDILDPIKNFNEADYIIYTNMDIGVMPHFYNSISDIISNNVDAFIINRRRIDANLRSKEDLSQIYAETGKIHNGYDCFVFRRELYEKFQLGNVCVGIPHVGNTLAFNLMSFATHFKLYTSKQLTFHLGFDIVKNWGDTDYLEHNEKEYFKIIRKLKPHLKLKNMPGSGYSLLKRHFKWLMNPTIHYPTFAQVDFGQWKEERYVQNSNNPKLRGYYEWLQKKIRLDN